jgi:hypothetical protein
MIIILFKVFLFFFKKSIQGRVFLTNEHLLITNGHGNHITLKVMELTKELKLDMMTLPSYTSHALQPLDVSCFKPFKTTFKKVGDVTM